MHAHRLLRRGGAVVELPVDMQECAVLDLDFAMETRVVLRDVHVAGRRTLV